MPDELLTRLVAAVGSRYEISDEIGRGGMGVVFRARDVRLRRSVAIKLLPPRVIIVSVFVALSYVVVRGLLVLVRWVWSQVLQIDVRWPDLGIITTRRRMEQVMALADERILTLTQELAEARDRIGELETERDGLERARRTAEARIEQLQHELQSAKGSAPGRW